MLIALLLAAFVFWALRLLTLRLERSVGDGDPSPATLGEQRAKTLVGLVRSVGLGFILIVTLFTLLGIVGVDIRPLLAGAGVVGLAIHFGAQSLVRDALSGLSILLENQFAVGDVVRIGDAGGLVEKITLRIVVLRDVHGVVRVIPNGEISRASNMTRSWSRADTARELRRRLKNRFEAEGIQIPFPHGTFYWGRSADADLTQGRSDQ